MQEEAEEAKAEGDDGKVKNVVNVVKSITSKVPIVQSLEKRLDIMQGLDPVMDGILEKMQEVTDNSNLRLLQKEERHTHTHVHSSSGVDFHYPYADFAPTKAAKDYQIGRVLDDTLHRID